MPESPGFLRHPIFGGRQNAETIGQMNPNVDTLETTKDDANKKRPPRRGGSFCGQVCCPKRLRVTYPNLALRCRSIYEQIVDQESHVGRVYVAITVDIRLGQRNRSRSADE